MVQVAAVLVPQHPARLAAVLTAAQPAVQVATQLVPAAVGVARPGIIILVVRVVLAEVEVVPRAMAQAAVVASAVVVAAGAMPEVALLVEAQAALAVATAPVVGVWV